jgi:hypothetical protein
MTTKKKITDVKTPVETVREDLRVLGTDVDLSKVDNWLSQEFLTLAGTVLTNVIGVLVLVGWVDATQAADIVKAVVATVAAVQAIFVNAALVWKYLAGRAEVEVKRAEMRTSYIQAVQAERARADYNNRW